MLLEGGGGGGTKPPFAQYGAPFHGAVPGGNGLSNLNKK